MKKIFLAVVTLVNTLFAIAQYTVGDKTITYTDPARSNRSIGVQFRFPGTNSAVANGQFPFVVFAHGFSMDQSPYYPYADSLAKRGYIVGLLTTETGLSPSHANFAQDLLFVHNKLIAENSNNTSFFYQHVTSKGAIGGHSMGGGSTVLSAQYGNPQTCSFTFAAATTNPSSITAAPLMTKPYLSFGGSLDCIAPVNTNQQPMYDSSGSACKFLINITGGLHCQYGNANSACSFGEGFSGCASSSLTRQQQIDKTLFFLVPFLDYYLKGDCSAWTLFENRYAANTVDTKQRNCTNTVPSNAAITGSNSFCAGSSTTLTAAPSGFQYLWSNNSTGSTLNVTTPGNYSVIVGNGTCSLAAVSVSVTQNSAPSTPSSIISSDTVCSGTASINLSVTNDPQATTYNWTLPNGWNITGGNNTSSITVTSGNNGGTISVNAENNCGPSTASTKQITVLSNNLAAPGTISVTDTVCAGIANISLSVVNNPQATTYNWTLPNGWSITGGDNTSSITATSSATGGTISVTAQNNCVTSGVSSKQIVVVASNLGTPGTVAGDDTICAGQSTTYSITPVSGAASYIWNLPIGWTGASNTTSIQANASSASGNISVAAVNQCGQSIASLFNVTVNAPPVLTGEIAGPDTFCVGQGAGTYYTISSFPADNDVFHWNAPLDWQFVTDSNSSAPIINVNSAGTLTVYTSNECGNGNILSLAVAFVDTPVAQVTTVGNTLSASPTGSGFTYVWYLNGQIIAGADGSSYTPTQSGNYSVMVSNESYCTGLSSETVFVFNSIDKNAIDKDLRIYPNPNSTNWLQIETNLQGNADVRIFNALGQLVVSSKITSPKTNVSLQGLQAGVYQLCFSNSSVIKKLVIE